MIDEALTNWVLLINEAGKSWIGRCPSGEHRRPEDGLAPQLRLEPAYVYYLQLMITPRGESQWLRCVFPIEVACGISEAEINAIEVTPAAAPVELAALPASVRAEICRMIDGAEKIREANRASRAGIMLAGAMPKMQGGLS